MGRWDPSCRTQGVPAILLDIQNRTKPFQATPGLLDVYGGSAIAPYHFPDQQSDVPAVGRWRAAKRKGRALADEDSQAPISVGECQLLNVGFVRRLRDHLVHPLSLMWCVRKSGRPSPCFREDAGACCRAGTLPGPLLRPRRPIPRSCKRAVEGRGQRPRRSCCTPGAQIPPAGTSCAAARSEDDGRLVPADRGGGRLCGPPGSAGARELAAAASYPAVLASGNRACRPGLQSPNLKSTLKVPALYTERTKKGVPSSSTPEAIMSRFHPTPGTSRPEGC
jgi:hypothetical protein